MGFVNTINVDNPLSSMFVGSICGGLLTVGADVVIGFVPPPIHPVIPVMCAAHVIHTQYERIQSKQFLRRMEWEVDDKKRMASKN
jgi:hypothetical protein